MRRCGLTIASLPWDSKARIQGRTADRKDGGLRYACLSQAEFSRRYALSPRSLQEWDQGRRRPESAVRAYLTVIDRNPEAVEKALMNKS